jgi:hypothetical protein
MIAIAESCNGMRLLIEEGCMKPNVTAQFRPYVVIIKREHMI